MEEYINLEIEDFGIYLTYPEWWFHRMEEKNTYLFWDEYVGSFRLTPIVIKVKGYDWEGFFAEELSRHANATLRKIGACQYVCYQEDIQNGEDSGTRQHFFLGGKDKLMLSMSYAYPLDLLEDEISGDAVLAGLEEVDMLISGMRIGEEE
jgi:hypothetical protein